MNTKQTLSVIMVLFYTLSSGCYFIGYVFNYPSLQKPLEFTIVFIGVGLTWSILCFFTVVVLFLDTCFTKLMKLIEEFRKEQEQERARVEKLKKDQDARVEKLKKDQEAGVDQKQS